MAGNRDWLAKEKSGFRTGHLPMCPHSFIFVGKKSPYNPVAHDPVQEQDETHHRPGAQEVPRRAGAVCRPAPPADEVAEATEEELRRASSQKSPQGVLAVLRKPADTPDPNAPARDLCLALDDVQDPGNLGTIVRVADWFGLRDVFCSRHSADVYGAKTVQATMGALARVRVHYVDLPALLARCREAGLPVYGTFMDGDSLYAADGLEARGVIVMGNEGNGISPEVGRLVSHRLAIPSYPPGKPTCESLNVGVAAAIVCAEFRRRAAAGE